MLTRLAPLPGSADSGNPKESFLRYGRGNPVATFARQDRNRPRAIVIGKKRVKFPPARPVLTLPLTYRPLFLCEQVSGSERYDYWYHFNCPDEGGRCRQVSVSNIREKRGEKERDRERQIYRQRQRHMHTQIHTD